MSGPLDHVRVVLVRPRQPANVGTAARAIANHGLGGLDLVDPPGFDPDRARWLAPGAGTIVDQARFYGAVSDAVADSVWVVATTGRHRKTAWPVLSPEEAGPRIRGAEGQVSILFGPEDTGLLNEDMALCHSILALPTTAHASLNLGQAVTVVAATLLQQATAAGATAAGRPRAGRGGPRAEDAPEALAPSSLQESLVATGLSALRGVDYLNGRSELQVHSTLLRLLGRAAPTVTEAHALYGMIKALARGVTARSG